MTRLAQSSRHPARRAPLVVGVVTLAVIAGLLLAMVLVRQPVTGSADPTPTPVPSVPVSPEPTDEPEPSDEPSQRPEPSEGPDASEDPIVTPVPQPSVDPLPKPSILAPQSLVRVLIERLNIRMGPGLDTTLAETVDRGEILVVNGGPDFGPRMADGYAWYPVVVLGTKDVPDLDAPVLGGTMRAWAALGTDLAAFVEQVDPRCHHGNPHLQLLESMLASERALCFGDRQVIFEGVYGCGGCGGSIPGVYEPYWLASPMYYEFISIDPSEFVGPIRLRFGPDSPEQPAVGSIVRVTGHFNDPLSATCEIATGVEEIPVHPDVAEMHCRAELVVDAIEVIGFDEGFPMG